MSDTQEFFGIGLKRVIMIGAAVGFAPVLAAPIADRTGLSSTVVLIGLAIGAVMAAGGTIKEAGQAALAGMAIQTVAGFAGNTASGIDLGGMTGNGSGGGQWF